MQLLTRKNLIISSIISMLVMVGVALPVIAQDAVYSMEQMTQTTQIWGQDIIQQKTAHLQQAAVDIVQRYEHRLAQQASEYMDQVALAVNIDPEPVVSLRTSEMWAGIIPVAKEVECNY